MNLTAFDIWFSVVLLVGAVWYAVTANFDNEDKDK
jgi:hypothetical protein